MRILTSTTLLINIVLLILNGYDLHTNQKTIEITRQNLEETKRLQSAYKEALCLMTAEQTGEWKLHIFVATLDGDTVEVNCPTKT